MPEHISKEDFRDFRMELGERFDRVHDALERLSSYQREQNGKVADMSVMIGVHEERLTNLKDSRGRLLAVGGSIAAVIFSWLIQHFGK